MFQTGWRADTQFAGGSVKLGAVYAWPRQACSSVTRVYLPLVTRANISLRSDVLGSITLEVKAHLAHPKCPE